MKRFIEQGYGWPAFIVLLLVSSVVMMGLVVMAARSDGGAQVVPEYYQQAVRWDSLATVRDAASTRGWTARLEVDRSGSGLRGEVTILDSAGVALVFDSGSITVSRPQFADPEAELVAVPVDGSPVLAFETPLSDPGLRDIQVVVHDAKGPVSFRWRREL